MTIEIFRPVLITWLSIPMASMVAAAFCSLVGAIRLARPAPTAEAALIAMKSTFSDFAVRMWYFASMVIVEVSLLVTKPPNSPRKALMNG